MSIFSRARIFFSSRPLRAPRRGFTIIEMMVVTSIMLFITLAILFRQAQFDSTTLLRSLAYSGALSVRQAQVYGTSIRETTLGSSVFARSYGIYVTSGATDNYVLFGDINNNGQFDSGETVNTFTIGRGYSLTRFCGVVQSTGTLTCWPTLTWLTIYFTRPNTDAYFKSSQTGEVYTTAYIEFSSDGGSARAIKVNSTGQIAVCSPNVTDLLTDCP